MYVKSDNVLNVTTILSVHYFCIKKKQTLDRYALI